VEEFKEMRIEEYDGHVGCREVLKMEKVRNMENNPHVGHLYLKNGLYRMVFDNSFSMMRSKELHYCYQHL